MAYVALGGADANYEFGIHTWDIAAGEHGAHSFSIHFSLFILYVIVSFGLGMLIVREAGGVVIDPAGGPLDLMSRRVLAASSIEIAKDLSKLIAQFYPEPRD